MKTKFFYSILTGFSVFLLFLGFLVCVQFVSACSSGGPDDPNAEQGECVSTSLDCTASGGHEIQDYLGECTGQVCCAPCKSNNEGYCNRSNECCSGYCSSASDRCEESGGDCAAEGGQCQTAGCAAPQYTELPDLCSAGEHCCGLDCEGSGGQCQSQCNLPADLGVGYVDCNTGEHCCMEGSPGGAVCGDGHCNGSETCSTCPGDCGPCGGGGTGGWNPANYAIFGLPSGRIYDIIYNFLFWILALFGAFGLIGFTIAGIMYLTSAGDDDLITRAKKAMKWSLVGVIVGLIGLVIIYAVNEWLGGWSRRF